MGKALYYGDCLDVLRKYVKDETIDLVYLDPPFNSNRDYNVLFKEQTGAPAEAQVKAFTDTWKWSPDLNAEWDAFVDTCPNQPLVSLMQSFIQYLKRNDVTAYLARMTPRLYELHRVLKPTGSLYLHCDPAASHYLKIILDLIFGPGNFRNEIIWKRTTAHGGASKWGRVHDVLMFATKSDSFAWNQVFLPHSEEYLSTKYRYSDEGGTYRIDNLTGMGVTEGDSCSPWRGFDPKAIGRHWAIPLKPLQEILGDLPPKEMTSVQKLELLHEHGFIYIGEKGRGGGEAFPQFKRYLGAGADVQDLIVDIPPINSQAKERLGYPTQKPVALLKRILEASSNPGDVVLDPFCGCGTTIMAAQELGREWIGIDVTSTATSLIEARLLDTFGLANGKKGDYEIIGLPTTEAEARELAGRDKHEFQKWAISTVPRAMPWQEKKGADGGVDGFVRLSYGGKGSASDLAIISVKGGSNIQVKDIRELAEVMKANKASMGLFISLEPPTAPMVKWAQDQGYVTDPDELYKVPVLQCRTVGQLLRGEEFKFPHGARLAGITEAGNKQRGLDFSS